MRRLLAGLVGLTLMFGAVGAGAQTPAAAAPIAAAAGALSVENTTIGDLLSDTAAHAVLAKDLPDLLAYPGLDQIKGMTLRAISAYPEAKLDDVRLAAIQKDLDSAKKS